MIEIDDPCFRSVVAMHRDNGRAAETRRLNANEPSRVGFHEDLDVVGLRGPQAMQHHPARAMALVLLDVKKRLRIPRPDDVPGRPDDTVDKVRLALKVADRDGQHLGTEVVGAPGELRMIGRMTRASEMKKSLSSAHASPSISTVSAPLSRGLRQSMRRWPPGRKRE